ncbi:MAG: DNA alkylation repair protein [Chitinophagaceae bacterium]
MSLFKEITAALQQLASKEKAFFLSRYFKTGPGEYGEGDVFWGITVPAQRIIVKQFSGKANIDTVQLLLDSPVHESRLTGVLLLQDSFTRSFKNKKATNLVNDPDDWIQLYLKNTHRLNNWDLVDTSAPGVLGKWLEDKDRSILYQLAKADSLWENRIAMVATLHFIRQQETEDVLKLSELFLTHSHDLMHKATGWMLREAWKRNPAPIKKFLYRFKSTMPRTMLRYAIEKMPNSQRKFFMTK